LFLSKHFAAVRRIFRLCSGVLTGETVGMKIYLSIEQVNNKKLFSLAGPIRKASESSDIGH
jgi:hypothetical protein